MNKMCLAHLGFFLLALLFITSQVVQAQRPTTATMNTTMMMSNYTTSSMNVTTKDKSGCGRTEAFTLLLPVSVAASFLYSWS